jgi:hypothetical protein
LNTVTEDSLFDPTQLLENSTHSDLDIDSYLFDSVHAKQDMHTYTHANGGSRTIMDSDSNNQNCDVGCNGNRDAKDDSETEHNNHAHFNAAGNGAKAAGPAAENGAKSVSEGGTGIIESASSSSNGQKQTNSVVSDSESVNNHDGSDKNEADLLQQKNNAVCYSQFVSERSESEYDEDEADSWLLQQDLIAVSKRSPGEDVQVTVGE